MTPTLIAALQYIAQEGGKAPGEGGGLLGPGSPLFPLMLIGLVFYFMILRPQRRQEKDRQAAVDALKKNDEVVTNSGIIGKVVSLKKEDEVLIESGTSKLRVVKSSIARVLNRSDSPAESATDDDDDESK